LTAWASRLLSGKGQKRSASSFVEHFQDLAEFATSAVRETRAAFDGAPEEALSRIVAIEHSADDTVREVHRLVDKTFIAPYDKRDIDALATRMDDIVDTLRTMARHLVSYRALEGTGSAALVVNAKSLCGLIERSTMALKQVIDRMPGFEHDEVRTAVREIAAIEDEADELLAQSIRTLFPDPNQPLTAATFAWREIFRLLERATDDCDHAVKVILSIARQEGS
jgi:uncharacterized protein Yka (UPF0111/DUF47 family)